MNITDMDPDLLSLELIGDDERGYDFLDEETMIRLKQLSSEKGVLSLYLDTRPETVQREPVPVRFKNGIKTILNKNETNWDHETKQLFEAVAEDVTEALEKEPLVAEGKGIALFVAPMRLLPKKEKVDYELFMSFHLPEAPADLIHWGQTPVISPLVVQRDEHPETGVVLFDREKVRFFLYTMGEAAEYTFSFRNEDPVPMSKSHTWHGYGTHNHLKWQEEHYKRYLRQAGIAISKVAQKAEWKWLVLASPDEQEAKHVIDYLPEVIQEKVIGYTTVAMNDSLNTVRDRVAPLVREAEIREEKATLEKWIGELEKSDGLAVSGVADTVLADQEYRLRTLIFPAGFIQKGWQCTSCHSLIADLQESSPDACPYCNSDQLFEKADIIGEMAVRMLQTGGEVEVIREKEHRNLVETHGIVGGLLRY